MSSRIVELSQLSLSIEPTDIFVFKKIPDDPSLEGIKFPSLDEFLDDHLSLDLSSVQSLELNSAIQQQYSEWLSWHCSNEKIKKYLAPIIYTSYDKYGLPILYFPYFTPLVDEKIIYTHNELENHLLAGMATQNFSIPKKDVIDFYRGVHYVCSLLELEEDDIVNNPSNIGYNPNFGLRIIDYGLVFDFSLKLCYTIYNKRGKENEKDV